MLDCAYITRLTANNAAAAFAESAARVSVQRHADHTGQHYHSQT